MSRRITVTGGSGGAGSNVLYTGTAHPANYEAIPAYREDPCTAKAEKLLGWKARYTWRKVLGLEEPVLSGMRK